MFVTRLTAFAERFLSERSFDLIVAPAVADVEFEHAGGFRRGGTLSVVRAIAGAMFEDVTADVRNTLTFLMLAFIPALYYAFLFMLCAPAGLRTISFDSSVFAFLLAVLLLSTSSAVICYWPERRTSGRHQGTP